MTLAWLSGPCPCTSARPPGIHPAEVSLSPRGSIYQRPAAMLRAISILCLLVGCDLAAMDEDRPELGADEQDVSCTPSLSCYPVRGRHNNGYDPTAETPASGRATPRIPTATTSREVISAMTSGRRRVRRWSRRSAAPSASSAGATTPAAPASSGLSHPRCFSAAGRRDPRRLAGHSPRRIDETQVARSPLLRITIGRGRHALPDEC